MFAGPPPLVAYWLMSHGHTATKASGSIAMRAAICPSRPKVCQNLIKVCAVWTGVVGAAVVGHCAVRQRVWHNRTKYRPMIGPPNTCMGHGSMEASRLTG